MRVLIVKVSALGDVVHALPVLAWLKSADPRMEIDWLVEESFAPLLDGHPLLRKVHRLRTKAWRKAGALAALRGAWGTIRELRAEGYDLVLDLQGNSKSGLFTGLCGAPQRFGFARDAVREWPNLLATNRRVPLSQGDFHISDRSLALGRAAVPGGVEVLPAGPLHVNDQALARVRQQLEALALAGKPVVVLHYGTTWGTKLWPLERWQELAARLCGELGIRPLLTWGNTEENAAAEAIGEACGGQAVIWPRGSLPELVALLDEADLVVGADTGPVHIAAALGTRTVSIFRVTDARRNGPRGEAHIRLQAPLDCSPCLRKSCPRDGECGRSITTDEVFSALRRLLRG
ncbi:lipopolysaccharide heptosyltransferase I [Desulfuromonas versatilis]|uniref:Lipopolysaccharide heptosyltransferase 1 n=1 Tax=Desulfuromonas versatilis TaxID=2802975 RepID=A0ABN6DYJ9_9BACT|nr:lipopolysaccharide heptosyltransferase I [Desulfuromonas versatilis]BCR05198.1 lipopolysaccharide heptosyltransferase I [Desulfuromonas versatilis]